MQKFKDDASMTDFFPFWTQEDAYYTKKQELINDNKR